jgi:regulator of replication initiation timing
MADEPETTGEPRMAEQDVGRLYAQIEQLQQQVKALEGQNAGLANDLEQYTQALSEQMTEGDGLKAQLAELDPLRGQLEQATTKLRTLTHMEAFKGLASDLGIKPEAVKAAWELGKFDASADEPDPKALRAHFGKFLEDPDHKALFTSEGNRPPKLPKGEGADRGAPQAAGDGKLRVTQQNLNDPDWMGKNFAKLGDASTWEMVEA